MSEGDKRGGESVNFKTFADYMAKFEGRLSSLEARMEAVNMLLDRHDKLLDKLSEKLDQYKWWIVAGFFGAGTLYTLISIVLKAVM